MIPVADGKLGCLNEMRVYDFIEKKFFQIFAISVGGPERGTCMAENGKIYRFKDNPIIRAIDIKADNGEELFEMDIVERLCLEPECDVIHRGYISFENGEYHMLNPDKKEMAPLLFRMNGGQTLGIHKLGNLMQNPELLFKDIPPGPMGKNPPPNTPPSIGPDNGGLGIRPLTPQT